MNSHICDKDKDILELSQSENNKPVKLCRSSPEYQAERRKKEREWREKNYERYKAYHKGYNEKNKEKRKLYKKEYYVANKERLKKKNRESYLKNKEKCLERSRKWSVLNRERAAAKRNEREKYRMKNDPSFHLLKLLRKRLNNQLKKFLTKKTGRALDLLGCDMKSFVAHLEKQFSPGMTWENHTSNGWHIDHIIPCRAFDLTKEDEQKKCFHYSNMQPLWAKDNLTKNDSLDWKKI